MHRTLAPLLLAALVATPAAAQSARLSGGPAQSQDSQADMVAKYEAKLKADYIPFGGWITDYDEARAKAAAEGKLIFAYFSRSYAP